MLETTMLETTNENIANELIEETTEAANAAFKGMEFDPKMIGVGVGSVAGIALVAYAVKNRKRIASGIKNAAKSVLPKRVTGYKKVEEGNEPGLDVVPVEVNDVK